MATFLQQFKALMYKNLLYKKRNKGQLFQEIFFPIYFVGILAMIKVFLPLDPQPAIPSIPLVHPQNFTPKYSQKILVCPNDTTTQSLAGDAAAIFQQILGLNATPSLEFYQNDVDMVAAFKEKYSSIEGFTGLQFNYDGTNLSYAIRMRIKDIGNTKSNTYYRTTNDQCRQGTGMDSYSCDVLKYMHTGFGMIQMATDTALMRHETGISSIQPPDVSFQLMPLDKYQPDTSYIQIISSLYMVMAYAQFVNFLTANIVNDKEKKIKEGMKMMGLRDSAYWASWAALYLMLITVVTIVITIIAYAAQFYKNSNMFLFFLILELYGMSLITFSWILTPFFQKAQTAGGLASMASMVTSLLYLAVSLTRTVTSSGEVTYAIPPVARGFLSLVSPCCVALAIDQSLYLDITVGMDFETARSGDFPLYGYMLMLLLDVVLYCLLAIYLDNVVPGNYGPRFPPYYIFTKEYWFGSNSSKYSSSGDDTDQFFGEDIEGVTTETREKQGLRFYNITKEFPSKDKKEGMVKAVDDFSLEVYEGQITCLLGHNGAGKTTLLNMLSGLVSPTSGAAVVQGYDVSNPSDVVRMRSITGVCPQHNILFEVLTCGEHLTFYAGLKGIVGDELKRRIDQTIKDVGLEDQKDTFAKDLSGGQKRKLSVAIALIGDPKIIYLDEPTAGMDPYSRRHLWNVLKEKKKNKLILLTTHFMDEADILADRKAFISKGKLRCCGSSLFLKSRFGIGYHLNMVVEPNCKERDVTEFIRGHVEGAEFTRVHGKELSYTLPLDQVAQFSELFSDLESSSGVSSKAESMGIKSYGVSMTTLEEVFMKLEEDDVSKNLQEQTEPIIENDSGLHPHNRVSPLTVGDTCHIQVEVETDLLDLEKQEEHLSMRQFKAMVKMWIVLNLRSKANLVFSLVLPVIFVIVGLVVNKTATDITNDSMPTPLSLQGLPMYARSKMSPSAAPPLLLNNSDGSAISTDWTTLVGSNYFTDSFSDSSGLLTLAPHYAGMKVSSLQQSGTPPKLDGVFSIFYNSTTTHSIPMLLNALTNSIFSLQANKSGATTKVISTTNLPWTGEDNENRYNNGAFSSIILIGMAFVAVAPTFAIYMVKDRETKVRSQLRVAGLSFWMYWGTHLVVDIAKFSFPGILCVIVILIMQLDSLSSAGAVGSLILLILFYIPTAVMFSYLVSFMFQKHVTAQQFLTTIFIFLGLIPYTAVSVLDMLSQVMPARILHIIFCIIDPAYIIFGGLYYIDRVYRVDVFYSQGTIIASDYFKFENNIVYTYFICIFDMGLIFMLLRMLDIKYTGGDVKEAFPCHQKQGTVDHTNTDIIENEDEDVKAERERVKDIFARNNIKKPVSIVENLRKEFEKNKSQRTCCKRGQKKEIKTAVRNASFAVDDGEVFGLLGPNGAGKTTVINMIVAEMGPTKGRVVVGGHDVQSSMSEAFQMMGFCPQHDALEDLMTLKEHLLLYATLRGVPENKVNDIAEWFIEQLKVQEHANKRSKKLSGGTKRKLSYALSMLGKPRIVLLDEPSTGMDPASKRFLWDTITSSFQDKGRGAILTTHYMEEADALCSRVGIMVNGKLECLGPTQHLKNKFGSGYILEIKLKTGVVNESSESVEQRMNQLEEYVLSLFPDAVIVERFGLRAQYKVPRNNVTSLAKVFTSLEEGKRDHGMEEYNFSQSSLEQVFLEFAKRQLDENTNVTDENVDNEQNTLEQSIRRRTSSKIQERNGASNGSYVA
nr:ATP-binding cassette sub-family A member 5-like isoform X3 [Crassostrea virginica]XP_022313182.1 ATP-binding cassette sub-family A member 5-like isoform X3 [Crassostrea virginica]XP_022313183.1 ATP-binding cassette sub-family A member 5-like isoform X3 [Crassostrea virginica]